MVSNMVKTGIVASVGVAVIILSSTLGWILVPDIVTSVLLLQSQFFPIIVCSQFCCVNFDFSLI